MKVLVVVASRHQGTSEIGDRVAETLVAAGIPTDVVDADGGPDPAGYDAVVLGSGVYFGRWLPAARRYVREYATTLTQLPVWAFSSGPVDEPGHPAAAATTPHLLVPVEPIEHVTFGGRIAPAELTSVERIVTKAVHAGTADFRDWTAVSAWATQIATSLTAGRPLPRRQSA